MMTQPAIGQTAGGGDVIDAGPACRISEGLRGITNFAQLSPGVASDPLVQSKALSDVNGDGVADSLVIDYYTKTHYAAVVCGSTGDVFYSLESSSADDYYFAVDAKPVGDADGDGVDDFLLVSHDMFLQESDVLLISGATGSGIARISRSSETDSSISVNVFMFSDVDKSGSSNPQDVYIVVDDSLNAAQWPPTDLNLDGVVDFEDVALAASHSGPISASITASIAAALGGTQGPATGNSSATVSGSTSGPNPGIFGWIRKLYNCTSCLITCGSFYNLAWDCRNQKKQAECGCYEIADLFDRAQCLADLQTGFIFNCIQLVASAAGSCGQCILHCHPLAP